MVNSCADGRSTCAIMKKRKRNHQRVHYHDRCTVILIPSRTEYIDAGIDLWYKQSDFYIAMMQVQEEMDAQTIRESERHTSSGVLYTSYIKNMIEDWKLQKF